LVTAAPRFAFSVRSVLWTPLRFDALFAVLRLRDALARLEAVFVARDVMFAAVRRRALRPLALARDLDAVVFAGVLLRVAAVLDSVFLEATVLFAARRPRALPRPALARDLDALVLAGVLLRAAAVLDTVFLEAAVVFFLGAAFFFAAGRPRALIPPLDFEVAFFDDLAIQDSFELGSSCPRRESAV
jgi:hypothetical protein